MCMTDRVALHHTHSETFDPGIFDGFIVLTDFFVVIGFDKYNGVKTT